jgi:hypothetical protein
MMSVDKTMWVRGLVLLGSMGFWGAQGALAVDAAIPLHPWQVAVKPGAAQAYFTNLKDGDEIQMPFVAHF